MTPLKPRIMIKMVDKFLLKRETQLEAYLR
jgi:hypothetical protein